MKTLLTLVFIAIGAICFAQKDNAYYDSYYKDLPVDLAKPTLPVIPDKTVNITEYGAVGDGLTLCTEAFKKGIEDLSNAGGGHLVVPAGVWITGPIKMMDNVDLHIEKNAVIYFSPHKTLYVVEGKQSSRVEPCISAQRCKNFSITGEGIVDGNGVQWRPVKKSKVSDVEWKRFQAMGGQTVDDGKLWYPYGLKGILNIANDAKTQEGMRNDLVRFVNCETVYLQGVTFQNSPRFHVHPVTCKNLILDGITVRCPWNAQNGDAIDLSDCQVVLLVNSTVDAGDDGMCMKSGVAKDNALVNGCEDILIENNTVFHAHGGFVIGSECVTGMKRIVVRNCRFTGTECGLRFKSGIGRGGKTENIYIDNIFMTDIVEEAIAFQCNYENKAAGREKDSQGKQEKDLVPEFTDIHISNVVCRGAQTAISASGLKGKDCVHDIEIKNSTLIYTKTSKTIDEATTHDIKLDNVKIESILGR